MISNDYRLPEGQPYINPLAEATEYPGMEEPLLNSWMVGTITVNVLLDPTAVEDSGVKAETLARSLALKDNPTLDIDKLIQRVRQRYFLDCQLLCNAIANGFSAVADEQFGR